MDGEGNGLWWVTGIDVGLQLMEGEKRAWWVGCGWGG